MGWTDYMPWNAIPRGVQAINNTAKGLFKGPDKPDLSGISTPYFEQDRAQLDRLMGQGSPWAQSAQLGNSQYGGDIRGYLGQLQDMAAGRGPSLAEQQFRAANDQTLSNQMAMANSGRGNPAMAARNAASNMARANQGLAAGVTQARTAEQMGALGQLGGALGMAGNLEFQRQNAQAGLNQSTSMANQDAWMKLLGAKLGLSETQLQALLGVGQMQTSMYGADRGVPTTGDKMLNMLGTVGGLLGQG